MKRIKHMKHVKRVFQQNAKPILFVAGFAIIGGVTIFLVRAATPGAAFEAENTTKSNVTTVSDASASNGSAIQFGGSGGAQGVAACDPSKGLADEKCWFDNTGVLNTTTTDPHDRWTEAQILAGQASAQLTHVTGAQVLDQANDFSGGAGTVNNPWIYDNKWITGCLEINVSNVIIQNVLVDWSSQSTACYINPTNPGAKVTAAVASGQRTGVVLRDIEIDIGPASSSPCAAYPWPTNCPDVLIENMASGLLLCGLGTGNGCSGGFIVQRANIHGGSAMVGRAGGTKIEDSYIHDAGRMHKSCYNLSSCDDYHVEAVWAQGQSNWSITHSFLNIWHYNNRGTLGESQGSSGACLCNDVSSNWALINSYFNGGDGLPGGGSGWLFNNGNGVGSKIVMQNLYYAASYVGNSTVTSDYSAGAWTPSYDANGIPQIDHSRCSGLYRVTAQGVATKTGC